MSERWADAVEHWRHVLAHPCAHHQVAGVRDPRRDPPDWRRAGRYDDAIAAKREAIAAGYRSVPDPEADIAECLLAAGRRDEADALFAELRSAIRRTCGCTTRLPTATPTSPTRARRCGGRWMGSTSRWPRAIPTRSSMQLLECAEAAWTAVDEPTDHELVERVETFCRQWTPVPSRRRWGTCHRSRTGPAPTAAISPDQPCRAGRARPPRRPTDPRSRGPRGAGPSRRGLRGPNRRPGCRALSRSPSAGSPPTSGPTRWTGGRTCSTTCRPTTSTTAGPPKRGSSASPGTCTATACTSPR